MADETLERLKNPASFEGEKEAAIGRAKALQEAVYQGERDYPAAKQLIDAHIKKAEARWAGEARKSQLLQALIGGTPAEGMPFDLPGEYSVAALLPKIEEAVRSEDAGRRAASEAA